MVMWVVESPQHQMNGDVGRNATPTAAEQTKGERQVAQRGTQSVQITHPHEVIVGLSQGGVANG